MIEFDYSKLPADVLKKFEESTGTIEGDVLKFAGLLLVSLRAREIFEQATGLTLQQWAEQVTENVGIQPEIADR